MKKTILEITLGATCAFAAGIVNGMFGTGGGIILVFWLAYVMTEKRGYSPRDIFATVIAVVLPMSLVSLWLYFKDGNVNISDALVYLAPGAIGGLIGAFLLQKINLKLLKKAFAAMVIYAGVKMLF